MTKGYRIFFTLVGILSMLLLGGCQSSNKVENQVNSIVNRQVDWDQGFAIRDIDKSHEMRICDYYVYEDKLDSIGDFVGRILLRLGENDYKELEVHKLEKGYAYYLKKMSADGAEQSAYPIETKDWNVEHTVPIYFDMWGDNLYFGIESNMGKGNENFLPNYVYIVVTEIDGTPKKTVDVREGLASLGCKMLPSWMYIDSDGYFYFMGSEEVATLYVINSEGKGILTYKGSNTKKENIFKPVRDNLGRIFFPVYSRETGDTTLLWKNEEDQWKELAKLEQSMVMNWYAMQDNQLFYAENDSLIKWDVLTGNREYLLNFKENGIAEYWNCMIRLDEKGEVYLRNYGEETEWVAKVSSEDSVYENPLTVSITVDGNTTNFIKGSVAYFSRNNNCPIQVKEMQALNGSKKEDHLLIDAVNGKGTDIMYVSYQEFVNLQSKGALLELEDLISEDIKENLLPKVNTFGMIEEKLYGLPVGIDLHTMFVNRQIYDEQGWSIEDVLRLADENTLLQCIVTADAENAIYSEVLSALIGYDLGKEKSCFIDWESKTSCFEATGFMNVLELVKEKGFSMEYHGYENLKDGRDRIITKEALGFPCNVCDPVFFNYLMYEFGDICYPLGYPAEDQQGNYLTTEGLLVVSANISDEKKEEIRKLFDYLFSMECQKGLHDSLSVLKGMIHERVVYEEHTDKTYWSDGTSTYIVLWQSIDGSAYMNDYEELLENAQVYRGENTLLQIVLEESIPFFSDDQTALDVTRKIDNRVQLYLDENY